MYFTLVTNYYGLKIKAKKKKGFISHIGYLKRRSIGNKYRDHVPFDFELRQVFT